MKEIIGRLVILLLYIVGFIALRHSFGMDAVFICSASIIISLQIFPEKQDNT